VSVPLVCWFGFVHICMLVFSFLHASTRLAMHRRGGALIVQPLLLLTVSPLSPLLPLSLPVASWLVVCSSVSIALEHAVGFDNPFRPRTTLTARALPGGRWGIQTAASRTTPTADDSGDRSAAGDTGSLHAAEATALNAAIAKDCGLYRLRARTVRGSRTATPVPDAYTSVSGVSGPVCCYCRVG
jgi:hypothetical protein